MPSLRRRLLAMLLLGFSLIWAGMAAMIYEKVLERVESRADEQLAQTAEVLWLLYTHPRISQQNSEAHDEAYASRIVSRFGLDHAFQVWDGYSLLARSANAPEVRMAAGYGASNGDIGDESWRFHYRVDALRGIDVIVGTRLASRHQEMRTLVFSTVWPVIAGLPILAALILAAVAAGLRPLQRVADDLQRRRPDSFQPIPLRDGPREVAPLIDALNGLLARVETAVSGERRFTASASHELRTPLAAIKTQAQLALRADSEAVRSRALKGVVDGVDRATHLVEQLLALARLDPDTASEAAVPVNLAELLQEAVAERSAEAASRGVLLEATCQPATITGHPLALEVLLRNLIDNALRYGAEGGRIDIAVDDFGDAVELSVSDRGPGIPIEERERVFDRFYRRLGTPSPGSGLGLSIVARVAELHGATITLESTTDKEGEAPGLRVGVRFPSPGLSPV